MTCDVCLEPLGPTVLTTDPPTATCIDCFAFASAAGIPLSAAADFLEMRRVTPLGETLKQLFESDPAPRIIAGDVIPAPTAPDPTEEPNPQANRIEVFQWPQYCGQWYAYAGGKRDRRAVMYGGCRTAHDALEGLARTLAARKYPFDGGYEPAEE